MQDMLTFSMDVLSMIPDFLMSEPICYLVGLMFLAIVIDLVNDIIKSR